MKIFNFLVAKQVEKHMTGLINDLLNELVNYILIRNWSDIVTFPDRSFLKFLCYKNVYHTSWKFFGNRFVLAKIRWVIALYLESQSKSIFSTSCRAD